MRKWIGNEGIQWLVSIGYALIMLLMLVGYAVVLGFLVYLISRHTTGKLVEITLVCGFVFGFPYWIHINKIVLDCLNAKLGRMRSSNESIEKIRE